MPGTSSADRHGIILSPSLPVPKIMSEHPINNDMASFSPLQSTIQR
jgi:hypothetical protein